MKKLSFVLVLCFLGPSFSCAQATSRVALESGFLSADKYISAFFGFSLPMPHNLAYHLARVSSPRNERYLFGLSAEKGHTVFAISAQQMDPKSADQAMLPPKITLNGRQFSKYVSKRKVSEGVLWETQYLTSADGYLLEFNIQSLDATGGRTSPLRRSY